MNRFFSLMACLALLAGCNSTDALIPQVDVGDSGFRSPPVNQADLDSMSSQPSYVPPQQTASVQGQPLASPQAYSQPASDTVMAQGDTDYTDPAGSFEAQASRLAQGNVPAQERQKTVQRVQQMAEATTTDDSDTTSEPRQAAPLQTAQQQPQDEKPAQSAAIDPNAQAGTIRFLPIIGAPVAAVTSLSKQLGAEARANGLTIKSSSDPSSKHILKGYFSALSDNGKTTVIYIWDVLDGSGNRLHRIQGQDSVDGTSSDPWSIVPPQTMQSIATKSIDAYLGWARANAG